MFVSISRCVISLITKAANKFNFVNDLIFGPREKLIILKTSLSLLYGGFVGFAICLIIFLLGAPIEAKFVWVVCIICALLCTSSIQFRCIATLMWLDFLGQAFRNIVKTFIVILVLIGPVNNILANTKEISNFFGCSAYLTYNLTKTKFDLAMKPLAIALARIDESLSSVNAKFDNFSTAVDPLFHEIEDWDIFEDATEM